MESNISHADLFALGKEAGMKFLKRGDKVCDIETINIKFADQHRHHSRDGEKPTEAEDVFLDNPDDRKGEVRDMLRKYGRIWYGKLNDSNVMEMRSAVAPDSNQLHSPPY